MNRLTKRIDRYVYYYENGKEVLAAEIIADDIGGVIKIKDVLARLADYEDLGYEPNEIKEILKEHKEAKKLNQRQIKDSKRCEEYSKKGEDMDCSCCSCSVCIAQQ